MSATYNKYLLTEALDKILELKGEKALEKFCDVYVASSLREQISNFPTFCIGLAYPPFGNNNMLRVKLDLVNRCQSKVTIIGENEEIIFTDIIPSSSDKSLNLLLVQIAHPKSFQQKTFLIENNF